VYVTFVDELASLGDAVVSMVGGVQGEAQSRTYRITRQPADGLAYAAAIAARYGLTYEALKVRIAR
jgi:DNA mismatch repair protein MutS